MHFPLYPCRFLPAGECQEPRQLRGAGREATLSAAEKLQQRGHHSPVEREGTASSSDSHLHVRGNEAAALLAPLSCGVIFITVF